MAVPAATTATAMAVPAGAAAVLTGPRRAVEVAAATPHAVYLATGDPEYPALCLADPHAVRIPCALVVARLPEGVAGAGAVGHGTLSLPGFEGRVARWWRVPRPRIRDLDAVVAEVAARVPEIPDLPDGLDVPGLLGRGPGLTPVGDDVLAGALVTLGALGDPAFHRLGAAVRELAPTRTTFVSTALLHHATRGECVPELAAVLDGVAGAVDALLRVGHTSGAGLARGVLAAAGLARVPA
jgi:hypothetical protein